MKDTIRDPPLPVTVPCHFQTPSLITQRKWVTAKVHEHTEGPALWYWCQVPKSWSHEGTWCKSNIQCMFIYSRLTQSDRAFLPSLQRGKPGWPWLEAHDLVTPSSLTLHAWISAYIGHQTHVNQGQSKNHVRKTCVAYFWLPFHMTEELPMANKCSTEISISYGVIT